MTVAAGAGQQSHPVGMIDTVKRVCAVLQHAHLPFALTGGFAAYARGASLSDHDVDFLIRPSDVEPVAAALREDGIRVAQPPEDWLIKAYDGDVAVDLIHHPVGQPVTDATLDDADILSVGGCHMPVISANVLVEHKVLSMNAHRCDMEPVLELSRLLREQVDWPRVRRETRGQPYAEAFMRLAELLDIGPASPDAAPDAAPDTAQHTAQDPARDAGHDASREAARAAVQKGVAS